MVKGSTLGEMTSDGHCELDCLPWEAITGKITSKGEGTVLFELSLKGKVRLGCGAIKKKDGHKITR